MPPHCSECGRQLTPWRTLDSVAFDAGWVKQARLEAVSSEQRDRLRPAVAVLMADSDLCLALAGWEAVHGDPKMDGSEVVWFDKCPDRPGKAVVELPPGYMLVRRREAS